MKKIFFLLIIFTILAAVPSFAGEILKLKNPDFEENTGTKVSEWTTGTWNNGQEITDFQVDPQVYKTGGKSALIINHAANDSRYKQEISVQGNRLYKISCWIKTEDVGDSAKGANISVEGITATSQDIKGTTDWQKVELFGQTSKDQKSFMLTLGLGGYSSENTGKAWFDDVSIEELNELPSGVTPVNLYVQDTGTGTNSDSGSSTSSSSKLQHNSWIYLLYLVLLFSAAALLYYMYKKYKTGLPRKLEITTLFGLLGIGLLMRVIIAFLTPGHPVDMGCFKAWAWTAVDQHLTGFYQSGIFCDYPPVYIYILFFVAKLASVLGIHSGHTIFDLFVRLPSITADIITAYLLYKVSEKRLGTTARLTITGVYIFNPVVLLNSTIWGQVDSLFTLLIVCALLFIVKDKILQSSILYALAILMKPQGIILLPVLFFELVRRKKVKNFVLSFISALITAVIVIIPFSRDPLWIFKLFINTAEGYKYATVNAYNLFALFGANWKDDTLPWLGFSYNTWGFLFIILITSFTAFLYYRCRNTTTIPFIAALILNVGVFVLSSRMHERYMFPAIALALFAYIYTGDRRTLVIFILSSITGFANTYSVFTESLKNNYLIPNHDPVLLITSIGNILLLGYIVVVAVDIIVKNRLKSFNTRSHSI